MRPYDMPPMTALVSFEAAARHVSFKTAASELNVTAAAVSHQVKALEKELQRPLFHRHHRGVELTETGAYHGHIGVAQIVISKEIGTSRVLFHDRITALGSPSFSAEHRIEKIDDLERIPLIDLVSSESTWTN